jgi:DNA-directed RNA polymerase sigma subunit (sigma70/sigma32)
MGRENLAAKLYGDGENLETHDPDLTLVPRPGNESEQEHDLEAIKEYRTTFSIPTKIPRGYADTRHKRPSPDEEVVLKDGKVDGLQVVLDVSKNHPLLSAERELELAKLIERGDLSAKEEMFKSNLRLVVNIAKRYRGSSVAFGDLVQYGMVGLNRAVEKFDWRKG